MAQRMPTLPAPPILKVLGEPETGKQEPPYSGRLSRYWTHVSSTWTLVIYSCCSSLSNGSNGHQQERFANSIAWAR